MACAAPSGDCAADCAADTPRARAPYGDFSANMPRCSTDVCASLRAAGVHLTHDCVTPDEEAAVLAEVDARGWEAVLSRRTQHYGHRFDYPTKSCIPTTEPIPPAMWAIFARLRPAWWGAAGDAPGALDACTVNEYTAGQGIAPHVDAHGAYRDGIAVLSLGDGIGMKLRPSSRAGAVGRPPTQEIWLPQRSLLELVGEARYAYTHGIASRKGDLVDCVFYRRTRRVSLTFRRVPPVQKKCGCAFPEWCDARPGGVSLGLPTRLGPAANAAANADTDADARARPA
ncbi:hypothetical protein M885DRAFT_530126 [Pelagophyceae sp. CCMP2097]|nr:hypothetical protein M885DRAFT_530126 [Pelagophyceae sp. CCMP2097]